MKAFFNFSTAAAIVIFGGYSQAQTVSQGMSRSQVVRQQDRVVNLRWQASALSVGVGLVAAEFKMSDYFSFGPSASYVNWRGGDVGITGSSVGLQATYAFDQIFQNSWFISPRAAYSPIRATAIDKGVEYSGDVAGTTGSLLGGYQWFWDSVNVNVAGGAIVNSVARLNLTDSSGNRLEKASQYYTGVVPVVSVDLGYTF
jgi:hypothetical protein